MAPDPPSDVNISIEERKTLSLNSLCADTAAVIDSLRDLFGWVALAEVEAASIFECLLCEKPMDAIKQQMAV